MLIIKCDTFHSLGGLYGFLFVPFAVGEMIPPPPNSNSFDNWDNSSSFGLCCLPFWSDQSSSWCAEWIPRDKIPIVTLSGSFSWYFVQDIMIVGCVTVFAMEVWFRQGPRLSCWCYSWIGGRQCYLVWFCKMKILALFQKSFHDFHFYFTTTLEIVHVVFSYPWTLFPDVLRNTSWSRNIP